MSKFIDKLNRISRGEPQPIGFMRQQSTSLKPKIQLVASLAQEKAESLTGHVVGADAVLIHIVKPTTGAEALQKISKALPDIPWGGWLQGKGGGIKQVNKAGCDFIVFPATDTPLAIIEDAEVGRILEIEPSLSDGLLRATNELPIDAVLVAGEQKQSRTLTWQDLMLFHRFAGLLNKPLLVSIPAKVTGGELQALWEARVIGVVVELEVGQPQDSLTKLRQVIDKLEFPLTRQHERAEPLLPRTGREPGTTDTEVQ